MFEERVNEKRDDDNCSSLVLEAMVGLMEGANERIPGRTRENIQKKSMILYLYNIVVEFGG